MCLERLTVIFGDAHCLIGIRLIRAMDSSSSSVLHFLSTMPEMECLDSAFPSFLGPSTVLRWSLEVLSSSRFTFSSDTQYDDQQRCFNGNRRLPISRDKTNTSSLSTIHWTDFTWIERLRRWASFSQPGRCSDSSNSCTNSIRNRCYLDIMLPI